MQAPRINDIGSRSLLSLRLMHKLDLHGLTAAEAMTAFVAFYNRTMKTMEVVHGYGSSGEGGVIKRKLRSFLEHHADHLTWSSGETIDGNPGYTVVHPRRKLPEAHSTLASGILDYCAIPRSEDKIAGKFRRHPAKEVKAAVRRLKSQGELSEVLKGGITHFVRN